VVDDTPHILGGVVLCDSIAGKGFARHDGQMRRVTLCKGHERGWGGKKRLLHRRKGSRLATSQQLPTMPRSN
jgi:hypothetical protein